MNAPSRVRCSCLKVDVFPSQKNAQINVTHSALKKPIRSGNRSGIIFVLFHWVELTSLCNIPNPPAITLINENSKTVIVTKIGCSIDWFMGISSDTSLYFHKPRVFTAN